LATYHWRSLNDRFSRLTGLLLGAAIKQGLELVRQRKDEYKANGISYYKPWIFLITDGGPTDEWHSAAALAREGESSGSFAFFATGVAGANMEVLKQISVRERLKLDGLKFRELFQWLSFKPILFSDVTCAGNKGENDLHPKPT
jgi:uncharacterized protein YegL